MALELHCKMETTPAEKKQEKEKKQDTLPKKDESSLKETAESSEKEINEKINKSLKYSTLDASFYSSMVGFGESFFSAFAVFLKATNIQLGLIGSLPQTLGSLSQLLSTKMIKLFKSRKKVVCFFAFLHALMYIPIALVFFFGSLRVFHLIIFLCIYWIFAMIMGPAWSSWMGDLIQNKQKGAYFGKRNRIAGVVTFVTFLAAGYILQHFSDGSARQYIGFAIIFLIAFFSRIISFIFLTKKYEPEYSTRAEDYFSFFAFLKKAGNSNFGKFVFFMCLMNFSVYLSAPFFTPYMLIDLKFSYAQFTAVIAAAIISKFITMPLWGMYSDRYGTKKVMSLTGILMPVLPLLWVISKEFWYLVLLNMYGGFVWAGFEIAAFNFIFDSTTSQKRATCVSYYNALNGILIFAGGLIGALIVKYNAWFWSKYYAVFILSFVFRYMMSLFFLPRLKETKPVEEISSRMLLFKVISALPSQGAVVNIFAFMKKKWKKKPVKVFSKDMV